MKTIQKQFKNNSKFFKLIILLSIFNFSGCKKNDSQYADLNLKIKTSSKSKSSVSKANSIGSQDENAWDSFISYEYAPFEFGGEPSDVGSVDIPKICDWVVAEQTKGMWVVTSREVVTLTKQGKKGLGTWIISGITHSGSDIDHWELWPISWTESTATSVFADTYASIRITGHVSYAGFPSGLINAYKPFKIAE